MAVQRVPTGNRNYIKLVEAWQPAGSQTVLWAQDMTTGRLLHLLQWGDGIYLPVEDGIHLGIGIYNGANDWRAYPTFVEATNLWSGCPSNPDECTPDHMWEISSGRSFIMDALVNPGAQKGRSLVIVPSSSDYGIGKATFRTNAYRGQIRVYERTVIRQDPSGYRAKGGPPPTLGGYKGGGLESETFATRSAPDTLGTTRGASKGGPQIHSDRQVSIGAGAERHLAYRDTGKQYHPNSSLVAALQVEHRTDLREELREAGQAEPTWFWHPNHDLWYTNWPPHQVPPTAPQVPTAPEPHRPFGYNRPRPPW